MARCETCRNDYDKGLSAKIGRSANRHTRATFWDYIAFASIASKTGRNSLDESCRP
jgi:hypothetical protein